MEPEDYDELQGAWAWLLCDARPVERITCRGKQGLWVPDDETIFLIGLQ